MQKKSDKELKNASVPEQVSPFVMSDKGGFDDGLDAAFAPESDGFRAFFTTSAAVVPKEMQEENEEKKNAVARKEKKPSLFSKARGLFSNAAQYDDEEEEEEDEGVFFPAQQAAPVKQTPATKKSVQSVKSDLFASYAVEEVVDESASKKPSGKVHFLLPAEIAAAEKAAAEPAAATAVKVVEKPAAATAVKAVEKPTATPAVSQVEKLVEEVARVKRAEKEQAAPEIAAKAPEIAAKAPEIAVKAPEVEKLAPIVKAPDAVSTPQASAQQLNPTVAPDPTEAIVNAILLERRKVAASDAVAPAVSAPIVPKPVEKAASVAPVVAAPVSVAAVTPAVDVAMTSEKLSGGVDFNENTQGEAESFSLDMTMNTAPLPEEDEQETAPKENIFTAKFAQATEKVVGWKQALTQKIAARKEAKQAEITLDEVELDVFSAQVQQAEEVSWFGEDAVALSAQNTTAAVQTDVANAESAPAAQADDWFASDEAASAPDAETEQIFANVQHAFAARVAQQGNVVAPAPVVQPVAQVEEIALETDVSALGFAPEVMPEQAPEAEAVTEAIPEPAPVPVSEIAPAPIAQATEQAGELILATSAETDVFATEVEPVLVPSVVTPVQAEDIALEAPVPEIAPAPAPEIAPVPAPEIAPAPAPIASAAQPEPDLFAKQAHHDYCMFDQMADEEAADEQHGEIIFVGAASIVGASVVGSVPTTAAATVVAATVTAPAANATAAIAASVAASVMEGTAQTAPSEITSASAPAATTKVMDFFTNLFDDDDGEAAPTAQKNSLLDDTLLADRAQNGETVFEETPARPTFQKETDALPEDAEGIQFGLSGMRVKLLVRVFTTGVFAVALFMLGLMGQGVLNPVSAIDPTSAPVPFLLVNLLLLLAAMGVSYPVLIEGVLGIWRKPSADTPVALATIAALVQLLLCLTLVSQFDAASMTLFSALAGIALFANALGSLVMQGVIQANFNRCNTGVPHQLAYKLMARDPLRTLIGDMPIDDPTLLVSRPVGQMQGFLEKSFAPRASDLRARWISYGLLGAAVLACLLSLLLGQSSLSAISSFAAVLCIGAPLSATLVSALPSALLQRACARVGAVVPGWQSIETLSETNVISVDASDLFPPLCAQFYGMKTFQKERIDLAILYAASILAQHGGTLQHIFSSMIGNKAEMLYPVKDLVHEEGLGFIGWCENYRVILGTRALMKAEGVALPSMDNETRYAKGGARQVLYLAVSGQIYAMFLVGYRGEKSVARALRTLRKEHIRLLVHSTDPTLTAHRIEEIYHLPEGFITLVRTPQAAALAQSTEYRAQADGTLLHLGFVSLVGGLKAASGAEQAERSASAIQLIWAGFSIALSLFLCITGGLMQVALIAIFLYQAAWSVLSLGVVLTKKFD